MKIICIGRNYSEHVKELSNQLPTEPVFFMKPDTSIITGNKPFFLPDFSNDIHHEVEIVLKICKVGKTISEKFASRYFDEIGIGIDFTARDLQAKAKEKGLPWEIAKAFEGSAPLGKFIPKKEINDIKNINFHLEKNGNMIFSFEKIISYVSRFFPLKTGDLIFTGTPAGVGPVTIGDHLQAYIENQLMLDFKIK